MKKEYCKYYIGVNCINGNCPIAKQFENDWQFSEMKCDNCFYYMGCDDCAAPYYDACPELFEDIIPIG